MDRLIDIWTKYNGKKISGFMAKEIDRLVDRQLIKMGRREMERENKQREWIVNYLEPRQLLLKHDNFYQTVPSQRPN